MKKIIWTALAVIICVTVFSGCSRTTREYRDARTVPQSITFDGYPMDASNQTVSWFVSQGFVPNPVYATADQSPFHSWLKEMLGVKIDWHFPIVGTETQALNLVLAQRDLPYIIYGDVMSDVERYIDEGTFRDLSPYMEEWSPAYWKWIHSKPEYTRAMKTDSGKYYGYGMFQEAGGWNVTYLGPVVNKTWLDECGLPMPVTISDWDRTLRVFKERYGAVLAFAWQRVTLNGTFISGAWGAHSFANFRLYVDDNRKIQLANIQPEYRNQLVTYNLWWKDGLIDQDFLSVNDTIARSNALNKKMGISLTSMGQLGTWVMDARNNNTGANWVALQYPTGDDGTLAQVSGGLGISSVAAVITTAVPDDQLELVMRMLDYAYTDEGFLFWNFGKQGISWDYNENGDPDYLPLVTDDPGGMNNTVDKYAGSIWNGSCIQATIMLHKKNTPESIAANDLWFYPNEEVTAKNKLPPGMTFTAEESTRAGELIAAISTYVDESSIRFITGQNNFNTWDNYVNRVNTMGLPELLRIYQAALDRYFAR